MPFNQTKPDWIKIVCFFFISQEIDISTITLKGLDYTAPLSLKMIHDGNISALVGYFDVIFEGDNMKTVSFLFNFCWKLNFHSKCLNLVSRIVINQN